MYMPADLVGRIQHNDKILEKGQIAERLKELKDKKLVHHIPNVGYQHIDYKEIMPNYPERGDNDE